MEALPPFQVRPADDRSACPRTESVGAGVAAQRGRRRRTLVAAVLTGFVVGAAGAIVPVEPAGAAGTARHKSTRKRVSAPRTRAALLAPLPGRVAVPVSPVAVPVAPGSEAETFLLMTNQARAEARSCGSTPYAPAPPLSWDGRLEAAARLHAEDQATTGVMGHAGADGSTPGVRITRAGYVWREIGENVAVGQPDAASVLRDWLASPGHCANIMNPRLVQMGMARVGAFWSQEFADPR